MIVKKLRGLCMVVYFVSSKLKTRKRYLVFHAVKYTHALEKTVDVYNTRHLIKSRVIQKRLISSK